MCCVLNTGLASNAGQKNSKKRLKYLWHVTGLFLSTVARVDVEVPSMSILLLTPYARIQIIAGTYYTLGMCRARRGLTFES